MSFLSRTQSRIVEECPSSLLVYGASHFLDLDNFCIGTIGLSCESIQLSTVFPRLHLHDSGNNVVS